MPRARKKFFSSRRASGATWEITEIKTSDANTSFRQVVVDFSTNTNTKANTITNTNTNTNTHTNINTQILLSRMAARVRLPPMG